VINDSIFYLRKKLSVTTQNIPWNKLNDWQKRWIEHTLRMQVEFGRPLPSNSFSVKVCKMILAKVA
jgi:hypothetical protein